MKYIVLHCLKTAGKPMNGIARIRIGEAVYAAALILARICGRLVPKAKTAGLIIYKPDGIGDLVLATSAIRHIVARSGVPVVLFCAKQSAELAALQFPGIAIEAMPGLWTQRRGDWRKAIFHVLRCVARYKGWDLVSLRHQPGPLDHAVFHILSPRVSYGVDASPLASVKSQGNFRWQFSHPTSYQEGGTSPRELRAHEAVVNGWAGCKEAPALPPPSLEGYLVSKSSRLIVFPTTRSPLRNYPPDQLATVIHSLVPRSFDEVVLCGALEERPYLEALNALLPVSCAARCRVLIPSDVSAAVRLIASSGAVLAMESAPAHIACALDKPGVFLLGGGHHGYFAPWGNPVLQKWLTHPEPCYNCNWRCPYGKPHCITNIQPAQIVDALKHVLLSD